MALAKVLSRIEWSIMAKRRIRKDEAAAELAASEEAVKGKRRRRRYVPYHLRSPRERLEIELFYSLTAKGNAETYVLVEHFCKVYGFRFRGTIATVHRLRSWRRGVKEVPTIQINGNTVWVGVPPREVLEKIFEELDKAFKEGSEDSDKKETKKKVKKLKKA